MFRPECFKMTNFDRFHRKAGGVQAGGVNALAGVLFRDKTSIVRTMGMY